MRATSALLQSVARCEGEVGSRSSNDDLSVVHELSSSVGDGSTDNSNEPEAENRDYELSAESCLREVILCPRPFLFSGLERYGSGRVHARDLPEVISTARESLQAEPLKVLTEVAFNQQSSRCQFHIQLGKWVCTGIGPNIRKEAADSSLNLPVVSQALELRAMILAPVVCAITCASDSQAIRCIHATCRRLSAMSATPSLDSRIRKLLERIEEKLLVQAQVARAQMEGAMPLMTCLKHAVAAVIRTTHDCGPEAVRKASVQLLCWFHRNSSPQVWAQALALTRRIQCLSLKKQNFVDSLAHGEHWHGVEKQNAALDDHFSVHSEISSSESSEISSSESDSAFGDEFLSPRNLMASFESEGYSASV